MAANMPPVHAVDDLPPGPEPRPLAGRPDRQPERVADDQPARGDAAGSAGGRTSLGTECPLRPERRPSGQKSEDPGFLAAGLSRNLPSVPLSVPGEAEGRAVTMPSVRGSFGPRAEVPYLALE